MNYKYNQAFTLVELLAVIAIIALLSAISAPIYSKHIENTKINTATLDLREIEMMLVKYYSDKGRYPDSLDELPGALPIDPWGNPYQFLNITNSTKKGKGDLRKDKNLVPINSDFDLYSQGPDGDSKAPLTAKASRDDIIRAGNGGFFGVASDF